jgi:hypothetical protein
VVTTDTVKDLLAIRVSAPWDSEWTYMDCEKTDLSFPWRSAQARDPRRRTASFGLDIIRHGLGDSEDGTGSERIFQGSSGTRRLCNQTGSVDQRQARTALDRGLKSVSCAFPAALLKRQNYLVELSGIRANGTSELVTTYAFRAVVK